MTHFYTNNQLNRRETGLHSDTTNTMVIGRIRSRNLNVSTISPRYTPTIFYQVIVDTIFTTVADNQHTVIKIGSTTSRRNNTTGIRLEVPSIRFNRNCNRLFGYSHCQRNLIIGFYIRTRTDMNNRRTSFTRS